MPSSTLGYAMNEDGEKMIKSKNGQEKAKPDNAKTRLFSSRMRDFWRRYKMNRAAVFGLAVIIFFSLVALFAPIIVPYNPYKMYIGDIYPNKPTSEHPMGIDQLGRDVFSRVIWGTRISLTIGFISAGISTVVGTSLGCIAGYYGGKIDSLIIDW